MGGGAKPFYPALMDMPSLTPEARAYISREAGQRIGTGSEEVTSAQDAIHRAAAADNPVALQAAAATARYGVLLVESGTAALQALNEGTPPRQIGLAWFKSQLNTPRAALTGAMDGVWGLTWYHITAMGFLVAFLAWTLIERAARSRRVGVLVEELKTGGPDTKTAGAAPKPAPPDGKPAAGAPAPAAPPKAPSAAAAAPAPRRPWKGILRVEAVFVETPKVKTFRLMEPKRAALPFTFLPGQYLTFSAEIAGRRVSRSYTISSSPTQRDYVELTVKREELGSESRHLHDHVAAGDLVEVAGPSGSFTFTGSEADNIVLIGGGVGVTPMMCVIRYLTDRSYPGDIFLLYGVGSVAQIIFRQELDYLAARHPNLRVAVIVEDAGNDAWAGPVGRITAAFITETVPHIGRRRVHLCGPPEMMEAVKAALVELDVPSAQVKSEAFAQAKGMPPPPEPAAPPEVTPPASAPAAAAAPVAPAAPAPPAAPGGTTSKAAAPAAAAPAADAPAAAPQVQFSKSGKTGALAKDQCVLEAAEAIGVVIDFECRVGICGRCKVPLTSGTVTMEVEEGLPPEDKARGIVLACQAKSPDNLVVDA